MTLAEKIIILDNHLVTMVPNCGNDSYIRGAEKDDAHPLMNEMFWEMGYLNSIAMINNPSIRSDAMFDCHPENKCFYTVVSNLLYKAHCKGFKFFTNFMFSLNYKHKIIFLLFFPPAYICTLERRERGLYARLFCRFKLKLIPLKSNKAVPYKIKCNNPD